MASIKKRTTASGDARYDVRYRTPTHPPVVQTKTFRTEKAANAFAVTTEADKVRGDWIDPKAGNITFADWWADWWRTTVNLRPSSRARDESYARNHVLPAFGAVRLRDIDYLAVVEWVAKLQASGLAPATVQKAHQILSKPLRAAVQAGKLKTSPADHVPLPTVERTEMRFLTPGEVTELSDAFDPRWAAMPVVAAYTGLRAGELFALRWARVDQLSRTLVVSSTVSEVRGQLIVGPPKTRAGHRSVPFPKVAAAALTRHMELTDPVPSGLVFGAPEGGHVRLGSFRRRFWYPACVAAGLGVLRTDPNTKREHYEGLRLHDLRHTAVAFWIAAGADPKEIAARAGHTSVSVVLDRYGHRFPQRADAVNDALDVLASSAVARPLGIVRAMGAR